MVWQIKDGVDVYAEVMKRPRHSMMLIENIVFLFIRWEWTGKFKTGNLFGIISCFSLFCFKGTLNPNCSAKVPNCHGWKPFGEFVYYCLVYSTRLY